jgi:hypothetical protein
MVANPFFCLKIGRLKATVRTLAHLSYKNKPVLQIRRICYDSTSNLLATIGILQPSQRDMPRDFALYATVGEVRVSSETSFVSYVVSRNFAMRRNKQFRMFRYFLNETKQSVSHVS